MYEVVIIGGSVAGLSAALALGRALRRVLIIDAAQPANSMVQITHNLIGFDGKPRTELPTLALAQVQQYDTVTYIQQQVLAVRAELDGSFQIATNDDIYTTRKILFASGVLDILPSIPGLAECWGHTVLHCPYCHGYEVANKKLGLLANGEQAYFAISNLLQWSKQFTIFTHGDVTLTQQQIQHLKSKNVDIVSTPINRIHHTNGVLESIELTDGSSIEVAALFTKPTTVQKCTDVARLGVTLSENGLIQVAEGGATNVYGVYAAGDCCSEVRTLATATAAGTSAAFAINRALSVEEFEAGK